MASSSFLGSLGPSGNQSGYINIRRDVQDAFYRYKMPRLQSKIEGKGNGIKTVIPNMTEIAKALSRPPAYITKFFGAELGALSTCDEKAAKYIVNGAHDAEKLQTVLDGFIGKFVLCQKCDNPETILSVSKKDGTVYRSCQACGHKGTVDMAHKLVSYIRANPPPKPPKKRQAKDQAEDANDAVGSPSSGIGNASVEGMVAPDDFDGELDGDKHSGQLEENDWAEESAAAARQDELASLSVAVRKKLSIKESQLDALDAFGTWLEDEGKTASNELILQEIETRAIPSDQAIVALVQVLLADDLGKDLKSRTALLSAIVNGERDQKALLGSMERLVGVLKPELMKLIPMVLQTLYNEDIVEEEALLAWRGRPSRKFASAEIASKVRAQAKPFFDWLEAAESDEDEDEDEDED
jgi:translation initiation factor 5